MAPGNPFDQTAADYDAVFTDSVVGRMQRDIVWKYLQKRVFPGMDILEVNCGTGEDAIFLSNLGCRVFATDPSGEMIAQCLRKVSESGLIDPPAFRETPMDELESCLGDRKFDLVLSDFSGMNCLEPGVLRSTFHMLNHFLIPGGRVILVVFGKQCIWEKFYMLIKGRVSEINRRSKGNPVAANIGSARQEVYYYSAKEMKDHSRDHFKLLHKSPVGLLVPPSYLDPYFRNRNFLLHGLRAGDTILSRFAFLSGLADHMLMEFIKK